MKFDHVPVLKEEVLELLKPKDGGIYFDGTLGGGGHTGEILKRTVGSRVYATDLDEVAIASTKERLAEYADRLTIFHDNFKNFKAHTQGIEFDGMLLDLGVSSPQLDVKERGFSYLADDIALDMRMNGGQALSAKNVVNDYSEAEIERILRVYGEERFSRRIAQNIVKSRAIKPIDTCGELVRIIDASIPAKFKNDGHPAKRTFQAIRIEVNGELDGLDKVLYEMAGSLKKGGRLAVITFHSLEDRIVKTVFKDLCTGCTCDKRLPVCVCHRTQICEEAVKKPVTAGKDELGANPRAKSAKLRVVAKL